MNTGHSDILKLSYEETDMVVKLQNCREVSQNQEFLIARLNEFINAIPKNSADDIYEA